MFAETAPSNGAIWDKFSGQHQHQSTKKHHIYCPIVLIVSNNNAHFVKFTYQSKIPLTFVLELLLQK